MKLNGFEISQLNNFYVTQINIIPSKEIRQEDLHWRHGIKTDRYAYLGGLQITISGTCKIDPLLKAYLIDLISYGIVKIEFEDGFYLGESQSIQFQQDIENNLLEKFTLEFLTPNPFKYKNEKCEISQTISAQTSIIEENDNIKFPYADVNFYFEGSGTIYTRGYIIQSMKDDFNNTTTYLNENYLTGLDIQNAGLAIRFPQPTYISRFYVLVDEILTTTLQMSDLEFYYLDNNNEMSLLDNEINYSLKDASLIGKSGKLLVFENINIETDFFKIIYQGDNNSPNYRFKHDETRKNCAIIVPEYFSFTTFANADYQINGQQGLCVVNGEKNSNALKGQYLRLYPLKTYAYATNSLILKATYTEYDIYEAEHV